MSPGVAYRLRFWRGQTLDLRGAGSRDTAAAGGMVWLDARGAPPSPEILAGSAQDSLGQPSLSSLLKTHAGKAYLLAANSAAAAVTCRFRTGAASAVTLPFEGRTIAPVAMAFTDVFAPYAVHVYTWEL